MNDLTNEYLILKTHEHRIQEAASNYRKNHAKKACEAAQKNNSSKPGNVIRLISRVLTSLK